MNLSGNPTRLPAVSGGTWSIWQVHQQINRFPEPWDCSSAGSAVWRLAVTHFWHVTVLTSGCDCISLSFFPSLPLSLHPFFLLFKCLSLSPSSLPSLSFFHWYRACNSCSTQEATGEAEHGQSKGKQGDGTEKKRMKLEKRSEGGINWWNLSPKRRERENVN